MKNKAIREDILVPIVGDGAIATHATAEGRTIPVLILDCDRHKEFLNLIYLHENSLPGDVICTWCIKRFDSQTIFLMLEFERPSMVRIMFHFDLARQALLADGIVQSRGVYLQPKESGQRVSEGINQPKILVEVHPETTPPQLGFTFTKGDLQMYETSGSFSKSSKRCFEGILNAWPRDLGAKDEARMNKGAALDVVPLCSAKPVTFRFSVTHHNTLCQCLFPKTPHYGSQYGLRAMPELFHVTRSNLLSVRLI